MTVERDQSSQPAEYTCVTQGKMRRMDMRMDMRMNMRTRMRWRRRRRKWTQDTTVAGSIRQASTVAAGKQLGKLVNVPAVQTAPD